MVQVLRKSLFRVTFSNVDADDKRKLERALELAEENNKLLRKVRGAQKSAQMFRIIYWILIIGSFLGAYYLIKPYVDTMTNLYNQSSETLKGAAGFKFPNTDELQKLMNDLKQN